MQVKTKVKKSKEMFVKSIKKLTKHEHFYSQLRDFLAVVVKNFTQSFAEYVMIPMTTAKLILVTISFYTLRLKSYIGSFEWGYFS